MTTRSGVLIVLFLGLALAFCERADGQQPARARNLGIPLLGVPGPNNGITDVTGVEVGHATIIRGSGRLVVGHGPVRTGVTAIFPRGRTGSDTSFAAWFTLNGNGEMTGTTWVRESGILEGPVLITNTHSVGVVRDAVIEWMVNNRPGFLWALPVVAETWDGDLNDINGFHVTREHAFVAMDSARSGPVVEGNVGGGTGMICHEFKGGIGTASRVLADGGGYTVGVLVQCNYGLRRQLTVAGAPVGQVITDLRPCIAGSETPTQRWLRDEPGCDMSVPMPSRDQERGSIIVVVATDAPLLPHQLERMAKRVALGIARVGGIGGNSSGDIFIAFSTANRGALSTPGVAAVEMLANERINPFLEATVEATEEAILNAMLAAETMTGVDDYRVWALPHDRLKQVLRTYGRLRDDSR